MISPLVRALTAVATADTAEEAVAHPTAEDVADILWLLVAARLAVPAVPSGPPPGAEHGPAGNTAAREPAADRPRRSSDADPAKAPRPDDVEQGVVLRLHQPVPGSSGPGATTPATAAGLGTPAPLTCPLELTRALRPFKRVREAGHRRVLDVEATVEASADARHLVLVSTPVPQRRLDVALVVDGGSSMVVWREVFDQFGRILEQTGAFRSVSKWELVPYGGTVVVRDEGRVAHLPDSLRDPSGRRVVLVATDTVGRHWYEPSLWHALRRWGEVMPTALLQVLPSHYWRDTALGDLSIRARAPWPAGPNSSFDTEIFRPDAVGIAESTSTPVIPVVALDPEAMDVWAHAVAAGTEWVDCVLAVCTSSPPPGRAAAGITAAMRVQAFRRRASKGAEKLAVVLAAAPVLSLPLIRILQERLTPGTGVTELAEVFVNGLIELIEPAAADVGAERGERELLYRFRPGVAELLRRGVSIQQEWRVFNEVSDYLAERTGLGDLRVLFADPAGRARLDPADQPFTQLLEDSARRLRLWLPGAAVAAAGVGRSRRRRAAVALTGVAGVGKSQLAVEYAWRHADEYRIVWLVDAGDRSMAVSGLLELAATLSLPTAGKQDEVLQRLWAALGERADWLLIYDDVDEPAGLAGILPPDTGRVLIVSRNPDAGEIGDAIELREFDRAESVEFLRARCPALSGEHPDQIAAALGDLPLALDQAGRFLDDSGVGADVSGYLGLLAADPVAAGFAEPADDGHPGIVDVAAKGRVRLAELAPDAAALFDRLAFVAAAPLPYSSQGSAHGGVQLGDATTTTTIVRCLTRLGLARNEGAALRVQHIVQAVVRAQLTSAERTAACAAALRLLAAARPGNPEDRAAWPAWALLAPHLRAVVEHLNADGRPETDPAPEPDAFRRQAAACAWYLYSSGQPRAARRLAEANRRRWAADLGPDHSETLGSAETLGAALIALGDLAAARAVYADILMRRQRVLGNNHPETLRTADALTKLLADLGEVAEARILGEQTLTRRRWVLGDDHHDTLASAYGLVEILRALGQVSGAHALCEETLAHMRDALGADDPDTLRTAHRLANLLAELGKRKAARDLDEDTLRRRRRVLGDDDPHTLVTAHNLADRWAALGETAAARDLDEDTLARRRRVLGEDHPHTLDTAHNLAEHLADLGETAAARDLDEDTLARRRRVLGEDHHHTLGTAHNLAEHLADLGEPAARELAEDTLARMRRRLGSGNPATRRTEDLVARLGGAAGGARRGKRRRRRG